MSSVNARRYNASLQDLFPKLLCLIDDPELLLNDGTFKSEICCGYWSISKIERYFIDNDVGLIVISGQRIADHRVTIAAKLSGTTVLYKMHGLYVTQMHRNIAFYVKKSIKVMRTLYYCYDISRHAKNRVLFYDEISNFIQGNRREVIMRNSLLQPDYSVVWSEYWAQWHKDNYFFSDEMKYVVSGNPDTTKVKTTQSSNVLTYIYQTLVEDGRISRSLMFNYYTKLKALELIMQAKISIKWHPRGDLCIKRELSDMGFEIVDTVTQNSIWIGHYSSLLGTGPLLNNRIVIHELPYHSTPQSIIDISDNLVKYHNDEDLDIQINDYAPTKIVNARANFGDFYNPDYERSLIDAVINNVE